MVHPSPFLDPKCGDPKDIATKREKTRLGHSSIIMQNYKAINGSPSRYLSPNKNTVTADLISNHTSVLTISMQHWEELYAVHYSYISHTLLSLKIAAVSRNC